MFGRRLFHLTASVRCDGNVNKRVSPRRVSQRRVSRGSINGAKKRVDDQHPSAEPKVRFYHFYDYSAISIWFFYTAVVIFNL